jgi:hypothetical protein
MAGTPQVNMCRIRHINSSAVENLINNMWYCKDLAYVDTKGVAVSMLTKFAARVLQGSKFHASASSRLPPDVSSEATRSPLTSTSRSLISRNF